MSRTQIDDDPFLPGQGVRATPSITPIADNISQSEFPTRLPSAGALDYQEVVGAGLTDMARDLATLVTNRIEDLNAWKKSLTRGLLPADITRYQLGRLNASAADPTIDLGGPSGLMSAFILRSDHVAPTPPADTSWGGTTVPITPREILAVTTVPNERLTLLIGFDRIVNGAPVPNSAVAFDPMIITAVAEAIARKEAQEFIVGAGTAVDPIAGLSLNATITATAATAAPYIDDAIAAVENLRTLGRYPNAVWISASLAKIWRQAKASTGGSYLFDPAQPMSIDGVPVDTHFGVPSGAATYFFVGDMAKIVQLHRILPGNVLYRVDWTPDGSNFNTDQTTFRGITRWDYNVTPGYGPSIIKVTGVNAP